MAQSNPVGEPEKRYRINLGDSCPVCRAVSRISFTADRPPQLPIAGCRDADGCRCELPASLPRNPDRNGASEAAVRGSGSASSSPASTLRCPECGLGNPAGTFYCERCEEPLLPEVMIPPDARRTTRRRSEEHASGSALSTNGHMTLAPEPSSVPAPAPLTNTPASRVLPATAQELEEMTKHGQIRIVAHPFANFGRLNQFITMLGALPGVKKRHASAIPQRDPSPGC